MIVIYLIKYMRMNEILLAYIYVFKDVIYNISIIIS